jgi:magnesium transporter
MRDCFDHSVGLLDLIESYREMCNGLMEIYLLQASNRMSEVMKTMAVITVFFLPLTFLTGLYGMNFDRDKGNMPELGWQYGYLWFWVWVGALVTGIYIWVKRKRWL